MENRYYLYEKKPNGFLDFSLFSESLEGIISNLNSIYYSLENCYKFNSDFDSKKMKALNKSKFFLSFDYNKAKKNFENINSLLKEKYDIRQKGGYYYSFYAGCSKMPKGEKKEVINEYIGVPLITKNSNINEFFITSNNYKVFENDLRNIIILKNNSNEAFEDFLKDEILLNSYKYTINKDYSYF